MSWTSTWTRSKHAFSPSFLTGLYVFTLVNGTTFPKRDRRCSRDTPFARCTTFARTVPQCSESGSAGMLGKETSSIATCAKPTPTLIHLPASVLSLSARGTQLSEEYALQELCKTVASMLSNTLQFLPLSNLHLQVHPRPNLMKYPFLVILLGKQFLPQYL